MSSTVEIQNDSSVLKPAGRALGWMRLGEMSVGKQAVNFLLVQPDCDAAEDFVASLACSGVATIVWQLDLESTVRRRLQNHEIQRVLSERKNSSGPTICVVPFIPRLIRQLERAPRPVRFIVLTDDLAALWGGAETGYGSSLKALKASAASLVDIAVFISSGSADRMLVSARKAKEFPNEALSAVMHFMEALIDPAKLTSGAALLGRPQPKMPRIIAPKLAYQPAFKWGVDSIFKRGIVCGWVKRAMSDEHVAVRVIVDGKEVAVGKAEFFRQQLFDLGIGDGSHAFAIDISSSLGSTPKRVEIRTVDGDVLLGEATMTASVGQRLDEAIGDTNLAS